MKTRKMRGGNLVVIGDKWVISPDSKPGNETTDAYRGLEVKTFTDLGVPITQPNSTEVLRDKVLVQRYRELCDACHTDECYAALNKTKKEIRQIIKLRTLAAKEHFKEVETEQDEIDRIGHEGRLKLWKSNYDPINDAFQALRKRLKKPYEVDTDILANDRLTLGEKKRMVTASLQVAVGGIGSIGDFSFKPFADLQVDVREIIKTTAELQGYVAEMPEGFLDGLTEIMKRTRAIQTAVVEVDRNFKEMNVKLEELIFLAEGRLPRVLELTTPFKTAVTAFSFSMPLPEINRFSESLEQFIRDIEEEMERSRGMLETRRIKLDGILQQINKEEDELLAEERKEKQLEEDPVQAQEAADASTTATHEAVDPQATHGALDPQATVIQSVRNDREKTKQDRKKERKQKGTRPAIGGPAETIGEPAEEPIREPARGEQAEEPRELSERGQIYEEKEEDYERVSELVHKKYAEQAELIMDAKDIEDLMRTREEIIRMLETTELTEQERQTKESLLETNLKTIVQKNPEYLELVRESDEKLKEIFKLDMIRAKLEQYLQEHADDKGHTEPTEEERLAQLKEDIRGLSSREYLTIIVDKKKLHREVTDRLAKLKKSHEKNTEVLDTIVQGLSKLTSGMPDSAKHHIEEWAEIFELYSQLTQGGEFGDILENVLIRLDAAKDGLKAPPHNLTEVVVDAIEASIIHINNETTKTNEEQLLIDKLLREQVTLEKELEILKSNPIKKGGTIRKRVKKVKTRKSVRVSRT